MTKSDEVVYNADIVRRREKLFLAVYGYELKFSKMNEMVARNVIHFFGGRLAEKILHKNTDSYGKSVGLSGSSERNII